MLITYPRLIFRGLRLPGGTPQVDWSNPVTAGLVGCWVTTGEQGNRIIRDLVSANVLTVVNGSHPATIVAGPSGMEARDNTNSHWTGTPTAQQLPGSQFSLLWFGRILTTALGSGGGTDSYPFGVVSNFNIAAFIMGFGGANNNICGLITNYSGTNQIFTISNYFSSASSGTYAVLVSMKSGGSYYLFTNGVLRGSGSAGSGTISPGTSPAVRFSNLGQNGVGPCVGSCIAALWSRQLTIGEHAWVSANPAGFLVFPGSMTGEFFTGYHRRAPFLVGW